MKKLLKTFWFKLLLINLLIIGTCSYIIIRNYKDSKTWDSQLITSKQSDIDPELARNVYSSDIAVDLNKLTQLDTVLNNAKNSGRLNIQDQKEAEKIYNMCDRILAKYKIKSGTTSSKLKQLKTYIDANKFIKTAYSNPSSARVNTLIGRVSKLSFTNANGINKYYLTTLSDIASDYNHVDALIRQILDLGTQNDNILTLNANVTYSDRKNINAYIDKYDLTRFKNIKDFRILLNSKKMTRAISKNNSQKQKDLWLENKKLFDSLTQNQYISVSSINTLSDVKHYHLSVDKKLANNILDSSKVIKLTYKGETLSNDMYFKKGLNVVATIDPEYDDKKPTNNDTEMDTDIDEQENNKSSSVSSISSSSTTSESSKSTSSSSSHNSQSEKDGGTANGN